MLQFGGHDRHDALGLTGPRGICHGCWSCLSYQPLVARHVHERQRHAVSLEVREPQVDGDAAGLFLFEAVGIGAGEVAHERALAVIDVSRRTYDDGSHAGHYVDNVPEQTAGCGQRELYSLPFRGPFALTRTR